MSPSRPSPTELAGRALGWLLAPITAAVSAIRHARMFHPEGVVYRARVAPSDDTPWPDVARRLTGPALVRLSSAWWRGGRELPDALGLAIRFRDRDDADPAPGPRDQDLLLATIRHPWTLPFAPLTTHVHDFLANDYYGVSPFSVAGAGTVYLRAVASRPAERGADAVADRGVDRGRRLARAVADGAAWWRLEARSTGDERWHAIARVALTAPMTIDEKALRFWPFRTARGLEPRGFVHALRRAAYGASQRARGAAEPAATAPG